MEDAAATPDGRDLQRAIAAGSPDEAAAAVTRLIAVAEASFERRAQLEVALMSRIAIEQAKGIIAERYGLGVETAFEILRQTARSNRVKLQDLVVRVRPNGETPPEIVEMLDRARKVGQRDGG